MTPAQFKALKTGDLVRGRFSGFAFVVTQIHGDRVTAVRSQDLANAAEWDLVDRDGRVIDDAAEQNARGDFGRDAAPCGALECPAGVVCKSPFCRSGTLPTPPAQDLTGGVAWLWTHCRALGMVERSDSGLLRDDVALFTVRMHAALAEQPEQGEAVATKLETPQFQHFRVSYEDAKRLEALPVGTKLYTAPPAQGVPDCLKCGNSGIVGLPPDNYFDCPDCKAPTAPSVPEGWKLVPVNMTDDMAIAFTETWFAKQRPIDDPEFDDAYAELLAAAPEAPRG